MIELVTVMILLGIVATFVISRFDATTFRQAGFHDELKAGLQFARKSAVAKRRQVCVAIAGTGVAGAGIVSLTVATAAPESGAVTCPTGTTNLNLAAKDRNCSNPNQICTPTGVALTAGSAFSFDALGRASAGVTFKSDGQSDIVVEQETGYVH